MSPDIKRSTISGQAALWLFLLVAGLVLLLGGCSASPQTQSSSNTPSEQVAAAEMDDSNESSEVDVENRVIFSTRGDMPIPDNNTVEGYDVTGDNNPDTLTFTIDGASQDYATGFSIDVNGKQAYRIDDSFYPGAVVVEYLRTKNNQCFLFVQLSSDDGDGVNVLLQDQDGSFRTLLNEDSLPVSAGTHHGIKSITAKEDLLSVEYDQMTFAVGYMTMTFDYQALDRGGIELMSDETTQISYANGTSSLVSAGNFEVFETTDLARKAFDVTKGETVSIAAAAMLNDSLYLMIKNGSGETGWIKAPTQLVPESQSSAGRTMFEGTGLAG